MTNVNIDSGNIDGATIATSDVTVGAGKTLDVSAGTLTLADDQISGDKVEGGTIAAVTITDLTSSTVDVGVLTAGTINGFTANGAINFASQAMTNVNIDSGAIDGTSFTIGATNPIQSAKVGSLVIDTAQIECTDTDGDLKLVTDGTGAVVIDNVAINGGSIEGTTIGASTRAAGNFTSLKANGNTDLTADVDISVDSGTAFRVGTTTNILKSVFIVDTTDGASQVTVAGDLVVNGGLVAGDSESGTLNIKGGLQYDVDTTKTASATLSTSEHLVIADASAGAITLTLPDPNAKKGLTYVIVHKFLDAGHGNSVTISAGSSGILSYGSAQSSKQLSEGHTLSLVSDGVYWYEV